MLVNVHEAKTHLSKLLERVAAGEEIVIGKAGRPVARLVPYETDRPYRVSGRMKGRIRATNDFDATPEWLVAAFAGDSDQEGA